MIPRYTRPEMGAIWADDARYQLWLEIELLVCEALHKLGVIPAADWRRIQARAKFDPQRIAEIERTVHHDFLAFVIHLEEQIGPSARFVHMGLTSSDVLDTALAVQLMRAADVLRADLKAVCRTARRLARRYRDTVMIGRTHGVHAEPITFGLKMAMLYDEFCRAAERMDRAREDVAVGKISGAVGTYAHIDPRVEAMVCRRLGLRPCRVSSQIVPRDHHAAFLAALAVIGSSVERWALEIRHLARTEVGEAEEFFARGQKGSSAMPHKRNPILSERLCGLARLLRGYAVTAMENVALWHERDISHSSAERVILPDATIALDYMLALFQRVLENLRVHPERMQENLARTGGQIHSQSLLLALVAKGLPRRQAYDIVQKLAHEGSERSFLERAQADPTLAQYLSREEIAAAFDLRRHTRHVQRIFRRLGLSRA